MPLRRCPVAQMRWFADGVGWARDVSFRLGELTDVLRRLPELDSAPVTRTVEICTAMGGGWLVGHRVYDPAPPDPKAVARGGAYVLRVAFVDSPECPTAGEQAEVRSRLATLPVPPRGEQNLSIEIEEVFSLDDPDDHLPVAPERPDGAARPGLLSVLAGGASVVAGVLLAWRSPDLAHELAAGAAGPIFAACGGSLVVVGIAWLWRFGWRRDRELRRLARGLEGHWGRARRGPALRGFLAPAWVGVADGAAVRGNGGGAPEGLVELPVIDVDRATTTVSRSGDVLVVRGPCLVASAGGATCGARPREWLHVFHEGDQGWQMVCAILLPGSPPAAQSPALPPPEHAERRAGPPRATTPALPAPPRTGGESAW